MSRNLTSRQLECLRLTAYMTDKEIARELGISEPTVKKHVTEACARLGVNRRKAALGKLQLMAPNGPYPSGPMSQPSRSWADHPARTEVGDGDATSGMDVERSGGGDGGVRVLRRLPGASLSGAAPESSGLSAGQAPAGDTVHGGGAGRPRFNYRPPPASRVVRLLLILILAAISALVFSALNAIVSSDHQRIQAVDRQLGVEDES
jgi:DNA-binding CsgD family transcriptional regulator